MKFDIVERNCNINDHLKRIAEQKLAKLDKYFNGEDTNAKVSFKREANSLTVEIMLDYCGKLVRATATSDNFYDDLDLVLPKIEGQIRKHRTRFDQHQKNMAFKENAVYETAYRSEEITSKVVKEKKFLLKAMTVEEAKEEMELLGHSFYIFLEAKTNKIQVLYLRNDGDLGLIEPVI